MQENIHYTHCAACGSSSIQPVLEVKDYTVSKKVFAVWHCNDCSLRFTQDVPGEQAIGNYYQSDNYISHSNTGKGLVNRLYHIVRKFTLASKKKLVEKVSGKNTGQLLDLGAGTGAFAGYMQQKGWRVTGLEPDAGARAKARELHGISLLETNSLFQLPAGSFDVITMWHVLEHVHALHEYLDQLRTLLKPGGVLLIAVPNYTSEDATLYQQYWAAYDVPRHLYHFSPASMRKLVAKHGMAVKSVRPMWFDSFYVSMLSEQYKNGKSNLVKAFWNGLRSNMAASGNKEKCSSVIYEIR
ncbi:MAG: class I SAM-dependent methyltransferase [Chitinophagaceae bacterium]